MTKLTIIYSSAASNNKSEEQTILLLMGRKKGIKVQSITKTISTNKSTPFFVGFDIAKIAGLVDVEPLSASKT